MPDAIIEFDPVTHSAAHVTARRGFLSGPDGQGRGVSDVALNVIQKNDPHRATKAFLRQHRDLFGHGPEAVEAAKVKRDFLTAHNGLHSVVWEQSVDDIPIFEGVLISHTTAKGELVSVSSHFVSDTTRAALLAKANRGATLTAPQAAERAAENLDVRITPAQIVLLGPVAGAEQKHRFTIPQLVGETWAELVWLPMNQNELRLCWNVVLKIRSRGETFSVLVDANSGEVLLRRCLTAYVTNSTFRVFTSDSPSPFSPGNPTPLTNQPPLTARALVTFTALNTNASPNGWIDDAVNETRGNNVDAHLDRNDNDQPDLPRPQGSPFHVFDPPLDLTQSPLVAGSASVVQLFYWCNFMHDKLYELGFTEAAGNFQINNFGRGGTGNDAVQADAQDGGDFNNANMSTFGDGVTPRMQMYLFNGPSPDLDGSFDAEIVLHEYTHGLSTRLVGGGIGISALQTGGMGEGWSDFYALALLSEANDDVNGVYAMGGYATRQLFGLLQNYYYGIRRYPYSTDLAKNPLTFRDIDPAQADSHSIVPINPNTSGNGSEVHNQGEVWCATLWEARANLITKYGWTNGNKLILQLATDGMKLSPANPTFLQARDAIILADHINNNGTNYFELWAAFAKRGMGASATSPASTTTTGVQEAFDLPDDLKVTPNDGFVSSGPVGGPFNSTNKTYTLKNVGSNALSWTVTPLANWLSVSTSGGLLATGAMTTLTVSLNANANLLNTGLYSGTVRFTNTASGLSQSRAYLLRVAQPDYFTELFEAGFDLDNTAFTFTPNGSPNFYSVCRETVTNFFTNPSGGNVLSLSDDDFEPITLSGGHQVSIYGVNRQTLFFNSNGHLTFDAGDLDFTESISDHYTRPRVAALFRDLDVT
ncbi:MAG TPA: M36 family metallopeptidase, partial [Verrucomicrobiae bacterium]